MIRAGRLDGHALEKGVVEVGGFQPGDFRGDAEEAFQNRQRAAYEHGGDDAAADGDEALEAEHLPVHARERLPEDGADETEDEGEQPGRDADEDARADEPAAPADLEGHEDGYEPADEAHDEEFRRIDLVIEDDGTPKSDEGGREDTVVPAQEDGHDQRGEGVGKPERGDLQGHRLVVHGEGPVATKDEEHLHEREMHQECAEHQQEAGVPREGVGVVDPKLGQRGEENEEAKEEFLRRLRLGAVEDERRQPQDESQEDDGFGQRAGFQHLEDLALGTPPAGLRAGETFLHQTMSFKKSEHLRARYSSREEDKSIFCFVDGRAPVLAVRADNRLNEFMADDVFLFERAKSEPWDALEGMERLHETGAFVYGQVDLGVVAGHHALGIDAQPGQEHEHLLGGGVLGLIQDDEGVVERPPAHVGERGYLDDVPVDMPLYFLRFEHVVEGVIQGPQVGENLLFQVAGQKAERLARLHRGPGEDDAVDLLLFERGKGHGHGEIGLARPRRPGSEHHVMGLDRLDVAALARGLGNDGRPFRRADDLPLDEPGQAVLPGLADGAQGVVELVFADVDAVLAGVFELVEDPPGALDLISRAFEPQPAVAGGDFDAEGVLQAFEELQVIREKRLQRPSVLELQGLTFGHSLPWRTVTARKDGVKSAEPVGEGPMRPHLAGLLPPDKKEVKPLGFRLTVAGAKGGFLQWFFSDKVAS